MSEVVDLAHAVHGPTGPGRGADRSRPSDGPGDVPPPEDAPTVVLLHGLGVMGSWWPPGFVEQLALEHRVVVPDLRDSGRSPRMAHLGDPTDALAAWEAGEAGDGPTPPYTLEDVAGDVVGLLDDLGVEAAHVVGASMGGMVAHHVALGWPDRVASLTSIMSTTGDPGLPPGDPEVHASLVEPVPMDDEETFVAASLARGRRLSRSPLYDLVDAERRFRAYYRTDPDPDPAAGARHLLAVLADGDRTERLRGVSVPTLVVHGDLDPMIRVEAGRATAAAIPDASYVELPDVGHELPSPVHDQVVDAITSLVARAEDARRP